jgi:DDE superfamily endonuclease
VEVLLSAAASPETGTAETATGMASPTSLPTPSTPAAPAPLPLGLDPLDLRALVEHDLLAALPADVADLLDLLPHADLYVQDEMDVRLHPTLTRVWSRKGRRGQRHIPAPGQNQKFLVFGAVDWRDGWTSVGFGLHRSADLFCQQLDHLVARSHARGRIALVLVDNASIHTPQGSKLVRQTLALHGDALRLVYTPAYDPDSNPIERLWRCVRHAVTHNHHRGDMWDLYTDTEAYFDDLDRHPEQALRHIGSTGADDQAADTDPLLLPVAA